MGKREGRGNYEFSTLIIGLIISVSVGYAALRYNVVGSVPWRDFSLFILDKGLALAGLVLLVASFGLNSFKSSGAELNKWLLARKPFGRVGFMLAIFHLVISVMLLDKSYFPTFFNIDNSYSLVGIVILSTGLLSLVLFWLHHLSKKKYVTKTKGFTTLISSKKLLPFSFVILGAHVFFIGYKGWSHPMLWQGYLPPITLIAFIFLGIGHGLRLIK